jgi:two-component system response regulator HydG
MTERSRISGSTKTHSEKIMVTNQTDCGDETRSRAVTRNKNVLVVDDDRLICWALERLSSAHDCSITSVNSGEEAIAALSRTPFEVVFLDVHLPDANGLELLQEVKRISPETKVAIMTADSSETVRKEALLGGAAHFIGKPFSIPEIRKIIDSVLNEPLENGGG